MPERLGAADAAATARLMWSLFEPVHTVSYFAPEPRAAFEQAGLRGYWRGYFAGRSAPLGAVAAAPAIAAFFSFAPAMVERALPGVWELISPADALAVREAGAVAALRRLLAAAEVPPTTSTTAADRLAEAATGLAGAGHVLGAANCALPVPDDPLARLWHGATVLREHRGDAHAAALVAADLDGTEALALRVGVNLAESGAPSRASFGWTREQLQPNRGWTDADWDAAAGRLTERGLLRAGGAATSAGTALYQQVENATDAAAARPWSPLTSAGAAELARLLRPVARACAAALPFPSGVGTSAS
jgi:hypothetical protein